MTADPTTDALMKALDFTEADLAANRRGELTEHQRGVMRSTRRTALMLPGFLIVVMLIALLRGLDSHTSGYPAIVVMFLAVIAVMAAFALRIWTRMARDLSGRVEAISGTARKETASGGRYVTYRLTVEDKRFDIGYKAYTAFVPGSYRLYYAPTSLTLLSAEALEDDNQVSE